MFAASKSGRAVSAATTDSFFPYVPLLLETTSTNGQQNNTFLDSSTNNYTITRNGTPTQGSVTPYWPAGQWSNFFSSSYLSVADSSSLRFGSANFTIEAWIYRTASGATHTIACKGSSTGPTGWVFQISSGDKLVFIDTSTSITGTTSLAANTWYYVAVVRAGTGSNQTTLYVNGVSDGTGTSATTFSQTDAMRIGTDRSAANGFSGYVSNLRLSNTNLTISSTPTTPLTALGSTIFLSCGYNRFVDGSTLSSAITVGTGTPQVQAFQPFSPAASYTAASYGGSGYFNGSTDYLNNSSATGINVGSSDFTVEAWVYLNSNSNYSGVFSSFGTASGNFGIFLGFLNTGVLTASVGNASGSPAAVDVSSSSAVTTNTWNHVAFVRNGTSHKLYLNGVNVGTTTATSAIVGSTTFVVGRYYYNVSNYYLNGYISNVRLVSSAVYTANFTPPTTPLTAISGTQLLTNFTNAGIYDAAVQNEVITAGNAQASTAQYKWAPTSVSFDGTGDYLYQPDSLGLRLGTGDYTIEFWAYPTGSFASTPVFLEIGRASATSAVGLQIDINPSGNIVVYGGVATGTLLITSASTISASNWYYIALVRSSAGTKLYINGSQSGSTATDTTNYSSANLWVGANAGGAAAFYTGYLQDLRVTKAARTITTPTAAFPTR